MNSKKKPGKPNNQPRSAVTMVTDSCNAGASGESLETGESMEEKLEREINWCVEQLALGLETQNPDSRQAKEATKVMKTLTNPKTQVVKKRQVMRNMFGDYRKTMQEQEKKSAAAAKRVKLSSGEVPGNAKSVFYKKSASAARAPPADATKDIVTPPGTCGMLETQSGGNKGSLSFETYNHSEPSVVNMTGAVKELNSSFKFNFQISERDEGNEEAKVSADSADVTDSKTVILGNTAGPFTFQRSDNSFQFNFRVDS